MVDRTVQSRVRAMARVLSEEAERSLVREGKCRDVTVEEWWRREPSSRFVEALVLEVVVEGVVVTKGRGFGWRVLELVGIGAVEDIW